MSVLSKKWSDIWSSHPIIVLDLGFREGLNDQFDFENIVNKILFQHNGPILKFVLDISSLLPDDWDIIRHWLCYVSNKGVKELTIENSFQSTYTLPSFLFNSKLSHLDITNCAFKMPLASTSFQNLVRLDLALINFDPILVHTILKAPLLLTMVLTSCEGLQYLNISSPRLLVLHINDSHFIDLSFLKDYTKLEVLTIVSWGTMEDYEPFRKFTLTEIICSFPKLTMFRFNGHLFKFAVPEVFPKRLGIQLENLLSLNLGLSFANEAQISAVIFLLNNAPKLHSIKIEHELSYDDDEEISMIKVQEYLTTSDCIEEDLMTVRKVTLEGFVNVENERLFMKLMLARCPSLVEVKVKPAYLTDQREIFFFILQVVKFPRTSLNVSIELINE